MLLSQYENATQQLFQALTSTVPLIALSVIDDYINTARNQVAAEGQACRTEASLALSAGVRTYPFSAFTFGPTQSAVLAIRSGAIGTTPLDVRGWEWFAQYYLPDPAVGPPRIVAQHRPGTLGNLTFFPTPSISTVAQFDAVCLPLVLVNDATPEALPYPWTDAVPFYAAWLCMMNAQRQADADMMFARYEQIMMRLAHMGVTPTELPSSMPADRGLRPPQQAGG